MSQTTKPAKASKKPLQFSPEVQSLLDNSQTHPIVLVLKLAMDNLKRRYDDEAQELLLRRQILVADLENFVTLPNVTGGISLYPFWQVGADITITTSFSSPIQYGSAGSQHDISEMFKALDLYAPRSAKGGFNRVMALGIYDKGPAFNLVAHCLFGNESGTAGENLQSMLPPGMESKAMRFAGSNNSIKYTNPKPTVSPGQTKGGLVQTCLENLSPSLAKKFEELGKDEDKLLKRMYSDLRLLATRAPKVRSLATLLRKMPDLLDHPELKLLLGYDTNPLTDRVKSVCSVLTGEALLKAGV